MRDYRTLAARVATSLPFRMVFAACLLVAQLAAMIHVGETRFDYKFNVDPDHAPLFYDAAHDRKPDKWDRLVVARWDAQHYEAIGLRGYSFCKKRDELKPGDHPDDGVACELDFFPTYGWMGALVAKAVHGSIDFALLGISLGSSFIFVLLWTSRPMVERLGVAGAYLALVLFSAFDTGYVIVTILTEPCLLALTLGAFVCLRRGRLGLGAILAGAATSLRVSGVATGLAFCAGLLVLTVAEARATPPAARRWWLWPSRAALMALSGWGLLALIAFFWVRFGDPLIYFHAHERSFRHHASLTRLLIPDGKLLMESIWAEPNEGVILVGALLWLALGHRAALGRFTVPQRAFWYVLVVVSLAIALPGSVDLAFGGTSRYMLTVLPIFFAMAAVLRRRPVALALWLFVSLAHAYHGDMCFFVGQNHPDRLHRCGFARNSRSEALRDGREQ